MLNKPLVKQDLESCNKDGQELTGKKEQVNACVLTKEESTTKIEPILFRENSSKGLRTKQNSGSERAEKNQE